MARPVARETARIFIQIPSYRDRECQWTIRDAFAQATHPARITVGVCWQFDPALDADCFTVETRPAQVRRVDVQARDARGLGWARLQAQQLWQGEEFTLQIDSHMRFAPGWDVTLLAELEACPSPWPVLTVYPPAYWPPDERETASDTRRMVQRLRGFSSNGVLQCTVDWVPEGVPVTGPKITAALAGGFVFGPSRILVDVPADPLIYFEGEEPSLAARLWTHGFDLFSPVAPVLFHYYRRADSRRPWDDASPLLPNAQSLRRLRQLFEPDAGDAAALGRFGLGTVRPLAAYERFAGVDFRARSLAIYACHYPYVFTPETAALLADADRLGPAAGAGLLLTREGEGLLVAPQATAIYQLTPAATWLWCAIEEALPAAERLAGFTERLGLSEVAAQDALAVQACHWRSLGLLAPSAASPAATAPVVAAPTPRRRAIRPPPDATPIDTWHDLLGQRLLLRCWDVADAAQLRPLLAALPAAPPAGPDQSPDQLIEVLGIGEYRAVARNRRFPAALVGSPALLASACCGALAAAAGEAPDLLLQLRGMVAATMLLVGEPALLTGTAAALGALPYGGSGGPAGRLAAAEPGLFGDMRLALGRDGRARPVPAPLLVPAGLYAARREMLDLPDDLPGHAGFAAEPVHVPEFAVPAPAGSAAVAWLVVLEAGATPRCEALSAAAAVTALLRAALPAPALGSLAAATRLLDWVEGCQCLRIVAPDAATVLGLLPHSAMPPGRFPLDGTPSAGL